LSSPSLRRLAVLGLAAALSACSSFRAHGVDLRTSSRLRVVLLPVRCVPEMRDPKRVAEEISTALQDELSRYPEIELTASLVSSSTQPFTADQLVAISTGSRAQAVLEITVAAYGKVKAKTVATRIGTSIARGTIAGAAAAGPAGPVAGAAAFAFGLAEGTAIWTSGFGIFNNIYSPVILDAKLYSGFDGKAVWSYSAFAATNSPAIKELPPRIRADREARLSLTAEKAGAKVVAKLAKTARGSLGRKP
jgi:hypothetical protein